MRARQREEFGGINWGAAFGWLVEEGSLTAGAAIALVAVLLVTLLLAMVGGKAGER